MDEPLTDAEWQSAVDSAQGCLAWDSAQQYGLVEGGPTVNVSRCLEILRRGQDLGFEPSADAIERFVSGLH